VKIGIIGCGLIGKRRALVAHQSPDDEVVIVADVDGERARSVAEEVNCQATVDWQEVVCHTGLDAVIVATPNKFLMPAVVAALENGKHVLCEKPPGRNYSETEQMVVAAQRAGRRLKIGFNHRHHPAIWKAHELCSQGAIGPLLLVRSVYGHGGRPGYDKEWRGDADLAGGGELLDQGVHIVDLCRWFLGDFVEAAGFTNTCFWDLGSLEDNAFVLLRTAGGQVAQFHTSWTQWKNRFSFEVIGRDGYVRVEGLGGSYGIERLEIGKRRVEGGAPDIETMEFPGPDFSWHEEWKEFAAAIREDRQPIASGEESLGNMYTIAAIYESAMTGQLVQIKAFS